MDTHVLMTSTGRTLHCTNVYKLVGKELATQFDCGLQVAKFQHFLLSKICRSNTTKECPPRLLNPFFLKEAYTKKKKTMLCLPELVSNLYFFFPSIYLNLAALLLLLLLYFAHDFCTISGAGTGLLAHADITLALITFFTRSFHVLSTFPFSMLVLKLLEQREERKQMNGRVHY